MREMVGLLSDDIDLRPLLVRVRDNHEVDFAHYREGTLRRRTNRRMLARNCCDLESYLAVLDSDPGEYRHLVRDLTVKYTEFFRDPPVFEAVRERVLPVILSAKHGPNINVWSAGCATGEETYSLAVLLYRAAEEMSVRSRITTLGTDIDADAVNTARTGSYVKDFLPVQLCEETMPYFHDDGRRITARTEIAELVRFQVHDLCSPHAEESLKKISPEKFDLILCRNVLIYLKQEAQKKVLKLCAGRLRQGGFLVVGTGETVHDDLSGMLSMFDRRSRIYQRLGPGSSGGVGSCFGICR